MSSKDKTWWIKYQGHIPCAGIFFPDEDWISLKSSRGYKLHTYRFHLEAPQAIVFLFHGIHVSSGIFSYLAKRLYELNIAVLAFDQECHGKSQGKLGIIYTIDEYINCGIKYIEKSIENYPKNTPIFILGESMGGTICMNIALEMQSMIKGMVLFAPALAASPSFSPFLIKLARCLGCLCPRMPTKSPDLKSLSRNPYNEGWYQENPEYYTGKTKARTGSALLKSFDKLRPRLKNVRVPFIIFQGGNDTKVNIEVNRKFVENSAVEDKEFVYYEEMRHEVCNEPEIEEIIEKVLNWISQRIS
ncbi:unnamed protein product [Blepharisma stoltei]|uniref:Serine aminopeptidase S33 domain-containing protein n=1 Tax=Blepharisma stoltei TaxID=1481888 RepID=A0AAU9IFX9_9CILI|nr:unnamed protein product [Blepharisma stoltei]